MRYATNRVFPGIGKCIYCGATDGLTREHIIAYALGGDYVFLDASCPRCSAVTRLEEDYCARGIFGALRIAHDYPTRRKHERPKTIPVEVESSGQTERVEVPVVRAPASPVIMPILPTAGILIGREPSVEIPDIRYQIILPLPADQKERLQSLKREGPTRVKLTVSWGLNAFMCMLAKIGHGFAVAAHGPDGFTPLLPDYILDRDRRLSHVIGGTSRVIPDAPEGTPGIQPNPLHAWQVGVHHINGKHYVFTLLQLFRYLNAPVYQIIAGEASDRVVSEAASR